MGKHAYLIMAHNNWEQLTKLLSCLDDPRNDIFIHIDKKSSFEQNALLRGIKECHVFFTKQIPVNWGGYSQIAAELVLLEAATQQGQYDRYHLLTGVDLPLRSQSEIHTFFDSYRDVEFISGGAPVTASNFWFADRLKYYYPFQELFPGKTFFSRVLRRIAVIAQKILGINRIRNSDMLYGIGSAYFDITDRFARHVVSQKDAIKKRFASTFCADEVFLQWVYLHWENPNPRYTSHKADHPYIAETYFDVRRAIDWTRGIPYTFKMEDFQMLMDSECLFARKFDESVDVEIVDTIVSHVNGVKSSNA